MFKRSKKQFANLGISLALFALVFLFQLSPKTEAVTGGLAAPLSTSAETTPQPTASATPNTTNANVALRPMVVSVADGDTFKVKFPDGKEQTVRLLGVDTPETVDPRKTVQCFGKEASTFAKAQLAGKEVTLEADATQGDVDKYNRLLRYVYLSDGTFFNLKLLQEGYATEYTYQKPYKFQKSFKAAALSAQQDGVGFWNPTSCNGKR
jgi:micrococcal nuclease